MSKIIFVIAVFLGCTSSSLLLQKKNNNSDNHEQIHQIFQHKHYEEVVQPEAKVDKAKDLTFQVKTTKSFLSQFPNDGIQPKPYHHRHDRYPDYNPQQFVTEYVILIDVKPDKKRNDRKKDQKEWDYTTHYYDKEVSDIGQ